MNRILRFVLTIVIWSVPGSSMAIAEKPSSSKAVELLTQFLGLPRAERPSVAEQAFAQADLTREDALRVERMLWADHVAFIRETRSDEMKAGEIKMGDKGMRFIVKQFGEKPASGRSLWISMHGGGGAPAAVNDHQWANQQKLYELAEGVYVAPRAPTNTWNLWHEGHIDGMFDRLIENLIVFEDVDPNRVYLTGYSAGGDGVYQLAPRMADRFAAAGMMAGHPNEASPLGLRNLPIAIHVGGNDSAYNRNKVAKQWEEKLDVLRTADPDGYKNQCKLHEGKGHWMDREEAKALPWMAEHTRNPFPQKVVWHQDDITHSRFYWLALEEGVAKVGLDISASLSGQTIELNAPEAMNVVIRLNDRMLNFDEPISVKVNGNTLPERAIRRSIATMFQTLSERGDPIAIYHAQIVVAVP